MARRSVWTNVTTRHSLTPATRLAAVDGTGVDRNVGADMHRTAMAIIYTGTVTDGSHTFEVQDSDDDVTYAAVADQFLQGTEPTVEATDDDSVFHVGYIGTRRFLRVALTASGGTTGGLFGALIALGEPRRVPVDHTT